MYFNQEKLYWCGFILPPPPPPPPNTHTHTHTHTLKRTCELYKIIKKNVSYHRKKKIDRLFLKRGGAGRYVFLVSGAKSNRKM